MSFSEMIKRFAPSDNLKHFVMSTFSEDNAQPTPQGSASRVLSMILSIGCLIGIMKSCGAERSKNNSPSRRAFGTIWGAVNHHQRATQVLKL